MLQSRAPPPPAWRHRAAGEQRMHLPFLPHPPHLAPPSVPPSPSPPSPPFPHPLPCLSPAAASAQAADTAAFSQGGFEQLLLDLQAAICHQSAARDGSGKAFVEERWERDPGNPWAGYGITRVLEGAHVLEKAAANVSIVRGQLTAARAKAMSARQGRQLAEGTGYFAGALSLVFHSAHPLIPTFRSDIRYFQVDGQNGWFGGGADLTPSYLFPADIREFHAFYRAICDRYHPQLYAAAKAQCDGYFYLPARAEHRGVGGIFFDDLDRIPPPHAPLALSPSAAPAPATAAGAGEEGFERAHRFTVDVARGFMDSFWPIVDRRRGLAFTEAQRQWQLERRGRYLEFNLLYDRGVKFGMDGHGRVESIMVSGERRAGGTCVSGERRAGGTCVSGERRAGGTCVSAAWVDGEVRGVRGEGVGGSCLHESRFSYLSPILHPLTFRHCPSFPPTPPMAPCTSAAPPLIAWRYNVQPQPGSPEEELVKVLKSPVDWA
ncbi:unnamed protein product [Closterium sp. Naga37s-1]|nr:unnamed protein product [Closterium sp. Naga37s-1]